MAKSYGNAEHPVTGKRCKVIIQEDGSGKFRDGKVVPKSKVRQCYDLDGNVD